MDGVRPPSIQVDSEFEGGRTLDGFARAPQVRYAPAWWTFSRAGVTVGDRGKGGRRRD